MSVGSINGALSPLLTSPLLKPSGGETHEVGAEHDGDADDGGAKTSGATAANAQPQSASATGQSGRVNIVA